MRTKPATLSVLSAEPGRPRPPAEMLERCAALGAPACLFDAQGQLAHAGGDVGIPTLLQQWVQSAPVQERLRAAVMGAKEQGLPLAQVTAFKGCILTVVAHQDGATQAGFSAAVL